MRRVSRGLEGGNRSPFGEEVSVGGDAQGGMMVKATLPAPFVVAKPVDPLRGSTLFEVLVVPLDPPAQLGGVHQGTATDIRRQRRQRISIPDKLTPNRSRGL